MGREARRERDLLGSRPDRDAAADEAFLRALYEEHGQPLLRHVAHVTGDRAAAEDIVQETLLRAWRRAPDLDRDRPLRPWLLTVADHIAVDVHRARQARPPEVSDVPLAALPGADQLETAMAGWQVEEAMATLTPEHRRVLVETYYRGRSVAEAADALQIPPGTVKSRCFYALRALRSALEERGWTG